MIRLGLFLLGAWAGVIGMLVHRHVLVAVGVNWPWGLVVVVLMTAVVARAASGFHRVGAAWFALGWAGVVTLEKLIGGGSYLVATDWIGWAFMIGSLGAIGLEVVRASRVRP